MLVTLIIRAQAMYISYVYLGALDNEELLPK